MGGKGSGGHNKIGDEERKRRGTYRADESEAVYALRAAQKVVTGPWLSKIPEPEFPLSEAGRAKYDEWTKELFDQNKLTKVTVLQASALALLYQKIHVAAAKGKSISATDYMKFQSGLRELNIATDAQITASPGARNRFVGSGFSFDRSAKVSVRSTAAPGSGKL